MNDKAQDSRERYARVSALFDAALDLSDVERDAFLNDATQSDPTLTPDVRVLLLAHARLDGFLERTASSDSMLTLLQSALVDRYVIRERIAVGGMATVYRADDVKHSRQVAIKVLALDAIPPESTRAMPQRFLDEIRVTAGLQHANVMPLFDSGAAGTLLYYVMPFVDGATLRQEMRRSGPMSLDDALRITRGVALGLEHAHAAGVVHRDLKPENVLLRDGQPLVCDFGIALATAAIDSIRHTQSGTLIGTPQYMSPEQASGATVIDARTDLYSLAVILYEMLVGDPPHVASTTHGVLSKVRAEQPTPVSVLRTNIPAAISRVIDRALSKLPADRYESVHAFRLALDHASQATVVSAPAVPRARRWWSPLAVAGGLAALLAIAAFVIRQRTVSAASASAMRFVVTPIADAAIGREPTITPDGSAIVYAGSAESGRQLFVRRVDELAARMLPGTNGALSTWVSPNGTRIAFTSTDDQLNVIDMDGRNKRAIIGVFRYSDAAWLNDSVLVFDSFGQQGLSWVLASGGAAHPLTQLDSLRHDTMHQTPIAIGDGRSIVFVAAHNKSGPSMNVGDIALVRFTPGALQSVAYKPLGLQGSQPFAYVDGWLLYVSVGGRTLLAARLDPVSGVVTGAPIVVLEQEGGGIESVKLATNGTLLYARRVQPKNAPVLVDSTGVATPVMKGLSGSFMNPRVSPDGRRIAVQGLSPEGNDAWLFDIATGTRTRLTTSGMVVGPAWIADGQSVVYTSTRDGHDALWMSAVDGTSEAVRVTAASGSFAASPASSGSVLLFQRRLNGAWSIWQAPFTPSQLPRPVVQGNFDAFMPSLSPNGQWLTYASSESGRYEIYLRSFVQPGAALQVSVDGGTEPMWSPDGTQIYFRSDRKMMAATIVQGASPAVKQRRVLFVDMFDGDMPMPHRNYDVMPDGKRFVMIAPTEDAAPETIVVLNWTTEMRQKIAASRGR